MSIFSTVVRWVSHGESSGLPTITHGRLNDLPPASMNPMIDGRSLKGVRPSIDGGPVHIQRHRVGLCIYIGFGWIWCYYLLSKGGYVFGSVGLFVCLWTTLLTKLWTDWDDYIILILKCSSASAESMNIIWYCVLNKLLYFCHFMSCNWSVMSVEDYIPKIKV